MTLTSLRALAAVAFATLAVASARSQERTLDIYWIDVEGGAATLLISPSGESLLYDAGWENDDRDARRIYDTAHAAGVSKIDHFVLSHFHADHAGGMVALSKRMPFDHCYDRGDFIEPANQRWRDAYLSVCKDKRTILKAGERIPFKGVDTVVVASDGKLITKPLPGGGDKPRCSTFENHPPDVPENQLMVSTLFTYGRFRFLDLADLDWEKELELVCPTDLIGPVTVWQTGRHGALDGAGAPGLLATIKPQIVIANNGPRKGLGGPTGAETRTFTDHYQRMLDIPGLEDIWQGHRSLFEGARNTDDARIANLTDSADCEGHWLKLSVRADGTFTITNGRTSYAKTYSAR
jgi:competence protein ComEC